MRRRPEEEPASYNVPETAFVGARRDAANQSAHAVQPMFASGGMSYWIGDEGAGYLPFGDGVQLVCSLYVPKGRQGFLKELRVAPYCPAALCDPWTSQGAPGGTASWRSWNRSYGFTGRNEPANMGALWQTPLGWEAAWDAESAILPEWRWSLRFFQGNVTVLRGQGFLNIPLFDVSDPSSWYLVPSIPVPRSAYPAGLPGASVGPSWDAQRLQILPSDKVTFHVPIPQDTTVLLFADWRQDLVWPAASEGLTATSFGVPSVTTSTFGIPVYPIGPSIGSMLGYTQAMSSAAAKDNLEHGWGG